jgi:hypothetical protein
MYREDKNNKNKNKIFLFLGIFEFHVPACSGVFKVAEAIASCFLSATAVFVNVRAGSEGNGGKNIEEFAGRVV